jgi:hypothetical protein
MMFKKLNRDGAENVFRTVLNVQGATITTGRAVSIKPATASCDGISSVIADAAGDYPGFVGIATQDIANNDYGLIQTSGFVASVLLSQEVGSITINAGDPLVPSGGGAFASAAPTYANSGFKYVIAASNVPLVMSAATFASGLIKMF